MSLLFAEYTVNISVDPNSIGVKYSIIVFGVGVVSLFCLVVGEGVNLGHEP